jgi:hypothetical protein
MVTGVDALFFRQEFQKWLLVRSYVGGMAATNVPF